MSLRLLLPEEGVNELMTTWPDEPRVYQRETDQLDHVVKLLDAYMETGCAPASEIAVVRAPNPSLNPLVFQTNGRTDPAKLRKLYESGHTVRLGNLQRVIPLMADVSHGIQQETGYSNYIHAFITPSGEQGLRHHWDQQMAVIVQLEGVKRWQLWKPPVEAPMREFNESWRVWKQEYIPTWEAAGPDLEVHLEAGQSMLLPRGWVHNPAVLDTNERSVHLTFAIRERTPFWIAERLVQDAIKDPEFRRVILPEQLKDESLAHEVSAVREGMIRYFQQLDPEALAGALRAASLTELEYTT
ncbi:JmjC domain-containing protein [Streptomyces vinaceus]|uniref:JmjC domain-containing protein n=1 Tax=Streptomyces vinaceus TaxID=1960 RepID=UPI0036A15DB1